MSDPNANSNEGAVLPQPPIAGVVVGNMGPPIILAGVEVDGVVAEPARPDEMVKVWTRLATIRHLKSTPSRRSATR